MLFPIETAPIYTFTNSLEGSLSPHPYQHLRPFNSHSDVCEVRSHCGFDRSSLMITNLGQIFKSFGRLHGFFLPFILYRGFSRQEYQNGLPFPSPVDHILSKLFTVIRLSWGALHSLAHRFIELDKAVIHVISLVSFLCLWFSVCLPSDG